MLTRAAFFLALLLILAAAAVGASAAHAHHLVATASIDGTLGAPDKDGYRVHTITWNASCGDPDADIDITISRRLTPKDPKKSFAYVGKVTPPELRQGPGELKMLVKPGTRWRAPGVRRSIDTRGTTYDVQLPYFHRAGRARLWLELDGERTNAITMPILPLPRGCEAYG